MKDITKKTLGELLFSDDEVVRNHAMGVLKELHRMDDRKREEGKNEAPKK